MEEWRDIVGYEDSHEISSCGRVRTKDRYVTRSDGVVTYYPARYLHPVLNADGYRQCKLCRNNQYITVRVHRMVAEAFIPNPQKLSDVNHKDSNRENNCVENLEWLDHKSNVQKAVHEGRHFCTRDLTGKNNPNYRNDTLKKYYANHPEKALELLSRPGAQNGRAQPIELLDINGDIIAKFPYIGACAEYLRTQYNVRAKVNSIRTSITCAIKENKAYHSLMFRFV